MELPISLTILICDDHAISRTLLRRALEEIGFSDFVEVADVYEAGARMEDKTKKPIDLIFSDWAMPGLTGLEFIKWVRSEPEFKDLPFIMVTAQAGNIEMSDAVLAGVSGFVAKPISVKVLKQKILEALAKHRK